MASLAFVMQFMMTQFDKEYTMEWFGYQTQDAFEVALYNNGHTGRVMPYPVASEMDKFYVNDCGDQFNSSNYSELFLTL